MAKSKLTILIVAAVLIVVFGVFLGYRIKEALQTPHLIVAHTEYPLARDMWHLNGQPLAVGKGICFWQVGKRGEIKLERTDGQIATATFSNTLSISAPFPFVQFSIETTPGFFGGLKVLEIPTTSPMVKEFSCPSEVKSL